MTLLWLLVGLQVVSANPAGKAENQKLDWWMDARFGLFIHWGLYSIPGGVWQGRGKQHHFLGTEWIMAYRQIPIAEYRELAKRFNPKSFDADSWVLAAKNAGMKYIVFTAKHHDGFAMYDSEVSDFNVVDASPFGRDIVAELAAACRKHNMPFGLYYSQAQDWTHRGGAVASFMKRWDPSHEGSFDEYIDTIAVPQIREILSKYGPISVLWWDTPQDMTPERAARLEEQLTLQPGILQNSRLVAKKAGDFRVFEGSVPASDAPGTPWEVCKTMNETWGFSTVHHEWASVTRLIRDLIDTVSLGGNFLLNVGPDADGRLQSQELERLAGIGDWMKTNGAAIYGTSGFRLKKLWQQGRITQKPGQLYASIFVWPPTGSLTIPVSGKIKSVGLLSEPGRLLPFTVGPAGVQVELAGVTPDPRATVLVLAVEGQAKELGEVPPLDADADGSFDLLAAYAVPVAVDDKKPSVVVGKREGTTSPITGDPREGFKLGGFASPDDRAVWNIRVPGPGRYEVIVHAGLRRGMPADCQVEVRSADQVLRAPIAITGDAQTFRPIKAGELNFAAAGVEEISVGLDLKDGVSAGGQIWRLQLQRLQP